MAQVDTSIYGNFQPPKIAGPFEIQGQYQQLQQGQNQNRLAQMQFKEAERVDAERNALTDIAQRYGNTPEYGNELLKRGLVKPYQDYKKWEADTAASGVELENKRLTGKKTQLEITQAQKERSAAELGSLINDPNLSPDKVFASIERSYASGDIDESKAREMIDIVRQTDPAQLKPFLNQILMGVMKPKEQVELGFKERDFRLKAANEAFNPDGTPNDAYQNYATSKARAGATKVDIGPTRVENITTQESEGSKVYGRGLGEMQVEIQRQGFQAPQTIANLDRMAQLLEGVDSGRFAQTGLEVAKFAKSFGIEIDPRLGNKQAAESLSIEMALKMRPVGSGPMTDKDFELFLDTVPNLAKTAEGRKQITATMKAKAKRDIEISKMAREYAKQNRGVIDDNFLDIAADYMANNPVVQVDAAGTSGGWSMKKKGQ